MWPWRRFSAAAAAVALASCASAPAAVGPGREPLDPARFGLFAPADAYVALRMTPLVRDVALRLLPSARPLIVRADTVYGAASRDGLLAAADGRFSPFALRMALGWSADWRRVPDARDRWRAADGTLEAALPRAGLLLFGDVDLAPLLARVAAAPGFAMPPDAAAALAGADAYVYAPAVGAGAAGGLPVRAAWAAFAGRDAMLRGEITLLLDGESGGLTALAMRAFLAKLLRDAGVAAYASRLADVKVQAGGGTVRATGIAFSGEELARVARMLLGTSVP